MATVFLLIVLLLPGQDPIMYREPADNLSSCIADITELLERFAGLHKIGRLQASCTVVGAEAESDAAFTR